MSSLMLPVSEAPNVTLWMTYSAQEYFLMNINNFTEHILENNKVFNQGQYHPHVV